MTAPPKRYPPAWTLPLVATSRRIDLVALVLLVVALGAATVLSVCSRVTIAVEVEDVQANEGGDP